MLPCSKNFERDHIIEIFHSNGASLDFLFRDLDDFQGQIFTFQLICEYRANGRDRANITIANQYEVMYLPSNGAIANIVHRDLDLHFQCHKISNANIWKSVRTSKNA